MAPSRKSGLPGVLKGPHKLARVGPDSRAGRAVCNGRRAGETGFLAAVVDEGGPWREVTATALSIPRKRNSVGRGSARAWPGGSCHWVTPLTQDGIEEASKALVAVDGVVAPSSGGRQRFWSWSLAGPWREVTALERGVAIFCDNRSKYGDGRGRCHRGDETTGSGWRRGSEPEASARDGLTSSEGISSCLADGVE